MERRTPNTSSGKLATIAGGYGNSCGGYASTVGGGFVNANGGFAASIAGGYTNFNTGFAATIGGGEQNTCRGPYAIVPGGSQNTAFDYGFAAGYRAKAYHRGSFVWADPQPYDFSSANSGEFSVRATGGVRFVSGLDSSGAPVAGVSLPAGSGSWSTLSDRNAKSHFAPVNPRELLEHVARLPIQSWKYKSQSEAVRHIGPTAQDFHAAFTVGEDDRHIATVDAHGVALAAIQGLNQKLEAQLKERDVELAALKQRLAAIEKLLTSRAAETGAVQ